MVDHPITANETRPSYQFRPSAEDGRNVVVIEPSDHAMFVREYERLLGVDDHGTLAEHSYEVLEYVYGLLENRADRSALRITGNGSDAELAYHGHCQQRTLGL